MKKKLILLTSLILIGILIFIGVIFNRKSSDKKMIASSSYSNFAWSTSISQISIFDDGSIYSWDNKNASQSSIEKYITIDNSKDLETFMLKEGKIKLNKVSKKDLNRMKDLIDKIDTNNVYYEPTCTGADMGSSFYIVYKDSSSYTLAEHGDCNGESETDTAKELIELINKYD